MGSKRIFFVICAICILVLTGCSLAFDQNDGPTTDIAPSLSASAWDISMDEKKDTPAKEMLGISDDPAFSFDSREVYVDHDGKQIFGVMYVPENSVQTHPALVIAHGYGGSYMDGAEYAKMLAQRGYVVYCFDFCGGSTISRSDGTPLEMSFLTEQADLEAVLKMMKEQPFVDKNNIFLMGISQGGAVSALAAAAHPNDIAGISLFFPAFNLVDEINDRFPTAADIPDTFDFLWMTVGRPYAEDIFGMDIYAEISSYDGDVLILHGDADSIVPISYSYDATESLPSAELIVIPGSDHGFYGDDSQLAFEKMLGYMNSHLRATAAN